MNAHVSRKAVSLSAALLIAFAGGVSAVQIKVSSGTTFTGDIVSQDDNFIVLQIGQARISLAKNMVTEITGLPPGTVVTGTAQSAAAAAQTETARNGTIVEAAPGKVVEITLKSGAKFKGTVTVANDEFITLEMGNGSRIDFYKSIIVDVRYFTLAPAPQVAEVRVPPPASAADGATVGKSVEITLKSGAKFKGKVASTNEQLVMLDTGTGPRMNIYKPVIAEVHEVSLPAATNPVTPAPAAVQAQSAPAPSAVTPAAPAPPVTPIAPTQQTATPAAAAVPEQPPRQASPIVPAAVTPLSVSPSAPPVPQKQPVAPPAPSAVTPAAPAPVTPVAPTQQTATPAAAPVPEQPPRQTNQIAPAAVIAPAATPALQSVPVIAPQPQTTVTAKRTDGKSVLALKNGTVFTGTIVSENDRFLTFSTIDGATINVLRRLIRTIDGAPYTAKSGAEATPADTSLQLQRTSSSGAGGQTSPGGAANGAGSVPLPRRQMPHVVMRANGSVPDLVDSLKSVDAAQRSAAARELGAMGQWASAAITPLVALFGDTAGQSALPPLDDDPEAIQKLLPPGLEAARALSLVGPTGIEVLKREAHSGNALVRQRAVYGLGEALDPGTQPLLNGALKDPDARVRASAAYALRFKESVNALIGALADGNGDVRAFAAATLGDLRDPLAVKALLASVKDLHQSTRAQAVAALGKIGAREAVAPIAAACADASGEVRKQAVIALGEIGDTAGVTPLLAELKDNDPSVRKAAAESLGDIRDPRAIPSLYAALQDQDASVRDAIAIAIKMHTEIPLLIGALDNQNGIVRENAAYILWLMTGKPLGNDKQAWVDWYANHGDEGDKSNNRK